MPEYLAPGVYVEEVSFRSKSIEGVPTSTTGMAGMTRYGPVKYTDGPLTSDPRLITSFTEFERVYGGLEPLRLEGGAERIPYLAHAVRAFFMNGGKRVYVSRVFAQASGNGVAVSAPIAIGSIGPATWTARWPGAYGEVAVTAIIVRSKDIARKVTLVEGTPEVVQAPKARAGAVVEITTSDPPTQGMEDISKVAVVTVAADGKQSFLKSDGSTWSEGELDGKEIRLVVLDVRVDVTAERVDYYEALGTHPAQKRDICKILQMDNPEDENGVVALTWDTRPSEGDSDYDYSAAFLMKALAEQGDWVDVRTGKGAQVRLAGGDDGKLPQANDLRGAQASEDDAADKATGLWALDPISDIAIVACPDAPTLDNDLEIQTATEYLIAHAENNRYRIAVVDGPRDASMTKIREFRGKFDTKYAAIYHPWVEILDPTERPAQGAPPQRILLPPSGFITGIYARNDIERGVYKAPANEVVRGLTRFESNITKARQDVLNPEGINALRHFPDRGYRVWGARTMTSDPEWKYVNVRRLFIYVEHSIDKGTQWAVFEPNNRHLWANIRSTVEDFLLTLWLQGALMGAKSDDAYFVRCDRTTMTQNDLDNGRLVCLVGIAPTKPAEFVIFRIGQWTADAKNQ